MYKNPFGFEKNSISKKLKKIDDPSNILYYNIDFFIAIKKLLIKEGLNVNEKESFIKNDLLLPHNFELFKTNYINSENKIKNEDDFQRKILGLSSYLEVPKKV